MGQHGLSYRKRRVNGAVHHVSLSLLLLATEFITILMKFPRDKQQKKKVAKMGQEEGKTSRREQRRKTQAGSKRIYFNSYFIRSFYFEQSLRT